MSAIRNLLVLHIHDRQLSRLASKYFKGRLIDLGCGTKPYKNLLSAYVTEHIGCDHSRQHKGNSCVDIVSSVYEIPVEDGSFDSALCTAVLEHLEEPECAIRECFRVLTSAGVAIYSAPFVWRLHEEPRDFYRYTKYGLRHLFEKAGFEVLEIKPLAGFWVTFGQMFLGYLYRFNRGPLRWLRIVDLIGLLIQGVSFVLDNISRSEDWAWMNMIVVRKR